MERRGGVPARGRAGRRRPLLRPAGRALAGLPPAVIERAAKTILASSSAPSARRPARALVDDLPLFAAAARAEPPPAEPAADRLGEALAAIDPDALSPREALEALYRLKGLAGKG